jgi:hypothetical protein
VAEDFFAAYDLEDALIAIAGGLDANSAAVKRVVAVVEAFKSEASR